MLGQLDIIMGSHLSPDTSERAPLNRRITNLSLVHTGVEVEVDKMSPWTFCRRRKKVDGDFLSTSTL